MTAKLGTLFSLVLASILCACGPKVPNYDYSQEPDPRRSEIVIGVEDALSINVWRDDELSTRVIVRPDGIITMPLVGDLTARGKTPSQLRKEIEKRIGEFLKEAKEVTVKLEEVNSYRFTVSGEVVRPGVIRSKQYLTVSQALAESGGFTRFAERNKISLTRRDAEGNIRRIPIVYDLIEDGSHPEMNLVLLAGDSLHVP